MKKLITTLAVLLFGALPAHACNVESVEAGKPTFCERHPVVCRRWGKFKHFCAETLVPVQWAAGVLTIFVLL